MESSKQHFEQQQPAVAGAVGNMKRLRTHTAASAAELREFLGQLKGRSPQEVMGIVAQSSLVHGITRASIACGVLLVVCTIIPYAMSGGKSSDAAKKQPALGTPVAATAAVSAVVEPAASESVQKSKDADLERAANAMGIGDSAPADAKTNPLDSKLDKLLDGIE